MNNEPNYHLTNETASLWQGTTLKDVYGHKIEGVCLEIDKSNKPSKIESYGRIYVRDSDSDTFRLES